MEIVFSFFSSKVTSCLGLQQPLSSKKIKTPKIEARAHEDKELVKTLLIDAVRTTRKFGLSWMFISQTLSSLSREILNQIRIYIFGFGLGWGIERLALKDIMGGQYEALSLYQLFRDPQSSLKQKEYPFMTVGPISPLSFSGSPLFFNALNYPSDYIQANFDFNIKEKKIETKQNDNDILRKYLEGKNRT